MPFKQWLQLSFHTRRCIDANPLTSYSRRPEKKTEQKANIFCTARALFTPSHHHKPPSPFPTKFNAAKNAAASSPRLDPLPSSRRHSHSQKLIKAFQRKKGLAEPEEALRRSKLDTLFHPLYKSPFPKIQERAERIVEEGSCPVCVKEFPEEEDIGKRKKPVYNCQDCGFPTHCSAEHYEKDVEEHAEICDVLRQINEDTHDVRCGRSMNELTMNTEHDKYDLINFSTWDTFIRTRQLPGFDDTEDFQEAPLRHLSKVLTYPMTIASVLYPQSPFGPLLTGEGYKSVNALYNVINVNPETSEQSMRNTPITPRETLRIFIINPRPEASSLPVEFWEQLQVLLPTPGIQIHFVGGQVPVSKELPNDRAVTVNHNLTLHYHNASWSETHAELVAPFDLYRDVFFLFDAGFGYPTRTDEMRATLVQLLDTKCAVFCTAHNEEDLERDVTSLQQDDVVDEIDWLLKPTVNPFRSLGFETDNRDLRNLAQRNWTLYGIRGKRYEVVYPKNDFLHQLA